MSSSPITHISDTARWVAVYRAWESARADALFRDSYADRLAGDRGREIAALMPRQARSGWPLIARTKLIDDVVERAVTNGCDCVVNLAAGLDARPYRLVLPRTLRWVEVDLPGILEEKERLLRDATPRCELIRIRADLAEAIARSEALARATAGTRQTLVITEGLLVYLDEEAVRKLATDLLAHPGVRSWVIDLASPELVEFMQKSMGKFLASAPMKFGPQNGVAFFEAIGWRAGEVDSIFHAARRLQRLPWYLKPFSLLPRPDPRRLGRARWSAVVELTQAQSAR